MLILSFMDNAKDDFGVLYIDASKWPLTIRTDLLQYVWYIDR